MHKRNDIAERMEQARVCVVMPTYNNAPVLRTVIDSVLQYTSALIVVNDGSTDNTKAILDEFNDKIDIVTYKSNRGKGYALSRGFDRATERGYRYALTIDSDGQHYAADIPAFIAAVEQYPDALITGNRNLAQQNMPKKNTFANKFSNLWFTVQTGIRLPDTQTGYRLYPLAGMKSLRPFTSRYEAELELLVRCAWRGIKIKSLPVKVYYAPPGERITHFRPFTDFARISLLNTLFTLLAVIYGYPSMLVRKIFR